ncbi:MAG: hypothetical protein ACM3SY_07725 [Candidatus Omnitrophota bacterium]
MAEHEKNYQNKLSAADEVKLMMEICKNHRDEIIFKMKEYGRQTNYLLAMLSIFPTLFYILLQSNYARNTFYKTVNENWGLILGIIFSFHFTALYLASKISSDLHLILVNAHVLKSYEPIISSYLPKEAEIRWESYWSPEYGFKAFPYKNPFLLHPNFFGAILLVLIVIMLNVSSMVLAYFATPKWYFITFIIPVLWIYMSSIHFFCTSGLFNWEREKPKKNDLKNILFGLFMTLYILLFFTAAYENVLFRPDLPRRLLNVYSVFPGDILLLIGAYFFLKLSNYGYFKKIKAYIISAIGIVSLIISGWQHFFVWTKDEIPGFIDPNITHLGISGYVHFLIEAVGMFLFGLMIFQFDTKKFRKVNKGTKIILIGFLFSFLYILCMFLDQFNPGGNFWVPSLIFIINVILMIIVLKNKGAQ